MELKNYPSISVVTPTLNAASVLEAELKSIREQDYPQNLIEIVIADGGSNDKTLEIAKEYDAKVFPNPLKTGEAGKSVGVKNSSNELIILIDSDNILPDKNWLKRMVEPMVNDSEVVGSEPWEYTYRKEGGFIERHSALIGMNDPIVMFYKNYDRLNVLTGKWTEIDLKQEDKGNWIKVTLDKNHMIPTIGANGTLFRSDFLKQAQIGDYLFDIDVLISEIKRKGEVKFAKVKIGIIHTFCESDIKKFARKQKRRIKDYLYYKSLGLRNVEWENSGSMLPLIKFSLYTILILPAVFDSLRGYFKKPDLAVWTFHPLACWITIYQYALGIVQNKFGDKNPLNRNSWKQ